MKRSLSPPAPECDGKAAAIRLACHNARETVASNAHTPATPLCHCRQRKKREFPIRLRVPIPPPTPPPEPVVAAPEEPQSVARGGQAGPSVSPPNVLERRHFFSSSASPLTPSWQSGTPLVPYEVRCWLLSCALPSRGQRCRPCCLVVARSVPVTQQTSPSSAPSCRRTPRRSRASHPPLCAPAA